MSGQSKSLSAREREELRAVKAELKKMKKELARNPYSKTRALSGTISDIDDYDLLVH